MFGYIFRRLAF